MTKCLLVTIEINHFALHIHMCVWGGVELNLYEIIFEVLDTELMDKISKIKRRLKN